MRKWTLLLASLLWLPLLAMSQESQASPELVVHLLDYLAKDYGGAVQDGKIISPFEYNEQVEFADLVLANAEGAEPLRTNAAFMAGVSALKNLIQNKGPADEVAHLARRLQQQAITLSGIKVAPTYWPDRARGAELYRINCAQCHGDTGRGDGPAGMGLDPAPSDFFDEDLIWNSSPFKFYNTIRLGVPGTGMAPFAHLSDNDVWALSFYLKSLPYADEEAVASDETSSLEFSLEEVATLTDAEISERLTLNASSGVMSHPTHGGAIADHSQNEPSATRSALASLRSTTHGAQLNPLDKARKLLAESLTAAQNGDFNEAQKLGVRAYLEGIEPIEPNLHAGAPGAVAQIESLMTSYRAALTRGDSLAAISAKHAEILTKLDEIQNILSKHRISAAIAFGAAFSIFLREGFEALLIILVLLSILRAMNQPKASKWVHAGWMTAVAIGVAAWFASGALLTMSGLSRELMEGGISLVAVAVLIYVGFWLHRHSEAKKWRRYLESKLKQGLSTGSYLGIALVSFLAVFREAFEVVLFLRAIWMDLDSSGQSIAGLGIVSSVGVLTVLSFFLIRRSQKLPVGLLFRVCSWTMVVLAVILAGKGVHSLQEAGLIGVSPVTWGLHIDLLGLYPHLETLFIQALTLSLFGVLVLVGLRKGDETNGSPSPVTD